MKSCTCGGKTDREILGFGLFWVLFPVFKLAEWTGRNLVTDGTGE